jgi:hypothetical protein
VSEVQIAQWCSICNARPSDGKLTVENPIEPNGEPVEIEACEDCVFKLDWKGGIVMKKENDHV